MRSLLTTINQIKPDFFCTGIFRLPIIILLVNFSLIAFAKADETNLNQKIIIAHRGASAYLPEHTLAAKALAYGMGADYLEQDVVLTKDNVPIVLHDIGLDAVTNVKEIFPERARKDGKFYALDFELHELKRLSINERKNRNGTARYPGRFPADGSDFRIPTLEEEIQLIQGLNKSTGKNIGLYTEMKSPAWHKTQGYDLSAKVLETLARYGYQQQSDNIYIQCFDPAELIRMRSELNSQLKLVQLIGGNGSNEAGADYNAMQTADGLKQIAAYAVGIGPRIDQVLDYRKQEVHITSLVDAAHKLGLIVHPYTLRQDALPQYVSSFDELMELLFIRADVDGVFTDFPDLAINFRNQSQQ